MPVIPFVTGTQRCALPLPAVKHTFARPDLPPAEMPDADFPLVLNTGRVQHQWHTLTKTGKIPLLNKLNPGPFIDIHPQDADRLGDPRRIRCWRSGMPATIGFAVLAASSTHAGGIRRAAAHRASTVKRAARLRTSGLTPCCNYCAMRPLLCSAPLAMTSRPVLAAMRRYQHRW